MRIFLFPAVLCGALVGCGDGNDQASAAAQGAGKHDHCVETSMRKKAGTPESERKFELVARNTCGIELFVSAREIGISATDIPVPDDVYKFWTIRLAPNDTPDKLLARAKFKAVPAKIFLETCGKDNRTLACFNSAYKKVNPTLAEEPVKKSGGGDVPPVDCEESRSLLKKDIQDYLVGDKRTAYCRCFDKAFKKVADKYFEEQIKEQIKKGDYRLATRDDGLKILKITMSVCLETVREYFDKK